MGCNQTEVSLLTKNVVRAETTEPLSDGVELHGTAPEERQKMVLVSLRKIIRATDLHSKRLAKLTGLTTPQLVVLHAIQDLGEVTAGKISAEVSLSQATVSTILDRLEKRELIERYRSPSDRRIVHSRLTEQGVLAIKASPPLLHEKFADRFSALPIDRQMEVLDALRTVERLVEGDDLDASPILDTDEQIS